MSVLNFSRNCLILTLITVLSCCQRKLFLYLTHVQIRVQVFNLVASQIVGQTFFVFGHAACGI